MSQDFSAKVAAATAAVRLRTRSTTARRSLNDSNVRKLADTFKANAKEVGGYKQALDTKSEYVAPVYSILREAKQLVERFTIDYPETGIRLIKVDRIGELETRLRALQDDLATATAEMYEHWSEIKADRQRVLVDLYDPNDYATDPRQCYAIELSYPAIGPDERLAKLHPDLYEAERQRVSARLETAVRAAEQAAIDELSGMLAHLIERLEPKPDGTKQTLKQSSIDNIKEYCQYFKGVTIGSNEQLDALVLQVEQIAAGVSQKTLKRSTKSAREQFATKANELKESLAKIVVDRPARKIQLLDD